MARKSADPAQPQFNITYREIQPFGTLKALPIGLEAWLLLRVGQGSRRQTTTESSAPPPRGG